MSEAVLILPNMRGGCATIDGRVHTLFRVNGRRHAVMARPDGATSANVASAPGPAATQDSFSLTKPEIAC